MNLEPDDGFPRAAHVARKLRRPGRSLRREFYPRERPRVPWSSLAPMSFDSQAWLHGLPLAVLTVSLIAVPVLVLQPAGMPRMRALDVELKNVEAENAELRRDVSRLRTEVKDLRESPAAVERIAREQLGLVRKSEVVFQFDKK